MALQEEFASTRGRRVGWAYADVRGCAAHMVAQLPAAAREIITSGAFTGGAVVCLEDPSGLHVKQKDIDINFCYCFSTGLLLLFILHFQQQQLRRSGSSSPQLPQQRSRSHSAEATPWAAATLAAVALAGITPKA